MHPLHKFLLFHLLAYLGRNADGSEIINGELAPANSMLYMASLQDSKGIHLCGGFLIRDDFVLTAAHCEPRLTHVVLGTHDLKRVNADNKISIERKYKRESYKNVEYGNDIMLLKLSRKARLGKNVKLILLPNTEIKIKDESMCHVAGWGFTRTGGKVVEGLQEVDVPIVNLEECKKEWERHIRKLPVNVLCAGGYGTNKGFCQGDSGGPLVCSGKAVGVVSFNKGANCDYPDVPNVYTDVSKYLTWIDNILKRYE